MSKNNMMKLVVLFMCINILIGCAASESPYDQKDVVYIGLSSALSGDLAFIGMSSQKAAALAVNELNMQSSKEFRMVYEDDQFNPTKAAGTFQRLVNIDNVDVLISQGSSAGTVHATLANEHSIPHINVGASSPAVAAGRYNFVHWTPPKEQARVYVDELVHHNVHKLALLTWNQEGAIAIRDAVVTMAKEEGITIVGEERFDTDEHDFRTRWQKIQKMDPDLVMFVAVSPEFELLLQQKLELGITIPVATIESPAYTDQPDLYNGNWYVDAATETSAFKDLYRQEFGDDPRVFAANTYDAIKIIGQVYNTTETVSPDLFLQRIYQIVQNYDGAFGRFTVDENGVFVSQATVKEMVNGKSKVLY